MWKSLLHHVKNRHKFKKSYPKYLKSAQWTAKAVKEPKSYAFVEDLLNEVAVRKASGEKIDKKLSEMEDLLKRPKSIAPVEMPEKQTVIDKRTTPSRFKKFKS